MKGKNIIAIIFTFILIVTAIFALSACVNVNEVSFKLSFIVDGTVYYELDILDNNAIKLSDEPIADPTKEGYDFGGWFWDNGIWEIPFTVNSLLNEKLTNNTSVYAKWVKQTPIHIHEYNSYWNSNSTYHWHQCRDCDERKDQAEHNYGDNNDCIICGHSYFLDLSLNADGISYTVNGFNGWHSYDVDLIIPASYNGKAVTAIGEKAFDYCNLSSVTISENVTSIGKSAFENCSSLTSVTIPESVTSVGKSAFENCSSLTSVMLPDSVTSVGDRVFFGCKSLTGVTMGFGVISIGDWAFRDCSTLTNIKIPNSVTSIGISAFSGCSSLTNVTMGNGATSIGDHAFSYCNALTDIIIPDTVISIGSSAFFNCTSLNSVTIGRNVTDIDYSAFSNCYHLAEVYNLSSNVIVKGEKSNGEVGYYALDVYNSLDEPSKLSTTKDEFILHTDGNAITLVDYFGTKTDIVIPNNVTIIGKYAFQNDDFLTSVILPESLVSIDDRAFSFCFSLIGITIPSDVTFISNTAFFGCYRLTEVYNLSSLKIVRGNTSNGYVGYYAFDVYDSLNEPSKISTTDEGIIIHSDGDSITAVGYIGSGAEIAIPHNITAIGNYAFYKCSSLLGISIPDSVTSIGYKAFDGTAWDKNLPNGLTYVGKIAYKYNGSMPANTAINLQKGTISIAGGAFDRCSQLANIILPDTLTSIGDQAFYGCRSLTSINIPDSVTSIGNDAFEYCSGLTIYCQTVSKPLDWKNNWDGGCPIVWDCDNNEVASDGIYMP